MSQKTKILLASQPVYSKHKKLFGYELFFRNEKNDSALNYGEDLATNEVLINLSVGLSEHLDMDNRPVFINFPEKLLFSEFEWPFTPENIVIELPASVLIDDFALNAIQRHKEKKFRFSLDHYDFDPRHNELLNVVDYVKVDALSEQGENTAEKFDLVSHYPVVWAVERVETEQQFLKFHDLGFSLFQGYFLAKPLQIKGQSLNTKAFNSTTVISAVNEPDVDVEKLSQIVSKDPYLSAQLLKITNSPVCALQRKISSLREAISYLGLDTVRNWALMLTLLSESSASEGTGRIVLTRAKACEEYAATTVFADREKAFLVGLLSGINLLFGIENEVFLKRVALHEEIISAVLQRKGFLGQILNEIITTEHEILQRPEELHNRDDSFIGSFHIATKWVEKALYAIGSNDTTEK